MISPLAYIHPEAKIGENGMLFGVGFAFRSGFRDNGLTVKILVASSPHSSFLRTSWSEAHSQV